MSAPLLRRDPPVSVFRSGVLRFAPTPALQTGTGGKE